MMWTIWGSHHKTSPFYDIMFTGCDKMKDYLKVINIKKMILVFIFSIIYNASVYGVSFCVSFFLINPITSSKLYMLLFSLIILYIISLISNWIYNHLYENFVWSVQYSMRNYYFMELLKLDPRNMSEYHTAYIQRTITMTSAMFLALLEMIITALLPLLIGIISYLIMAFKASPLMAIISIVIFITAFIARYKMQKNRMKYTEDMYKAAGEFDSSYDDFIQNIFTIIRLHADKFVFKHLNVKLDNLIQKMQTDDDKKANERTVFTILTNILYLLVIITAIIMHNNGKEVISYVLFFFTILGTIISKLEATSLSINSLFEYKINKKKLDEIIGYRKEKEIIKKWNNIKIENGKFKYPNRNFEISIPYFEMDSKDKVCVSGESGQGKTTILNILSNFYELNSGDIFVDDKNIKNKKLDVIYISQDVVLFDLSIKDNLTLGRNIPKQRIMELIEEAGLKEWFNNLENGLEEKVGQKGIKLSAGQQQRLNIIRGILLDSDFYFFDEPTSNLDSESEEKIINMIDKYLSEKPFIIVSHRDKIKKICNKEYVFENHTMKPLDNV